MSSLEPRHVFNFKVDFLDPASGEDVALCSGKFSECSGLEATMEPLAIKAGGHNYGALQRPGPVTFATVILKRGISDSRHLWQWFDFINQQGKYAYRLNVTIALLDHAQKPILRWELANALPVKIKLPDLGATQNEIGIEELHIVHEGLTVPVGE